MQNAGWGIASFARSAELLKHTWPGWSSSGVEGRFMSWVHKLIMPQLQHEMLNRLPLANWQTTVAGETTTSNPHRTDQVSSCRKATSQLSACISDYQLQLC